MVIPPQDQPITSLADVAQLAKVSIATASRVLTGSSHPVAEKTRRRVVSAAERLDYVPSAVGRALVTKRTALIGVIVNDISDPYFAEIARGIDDAARDAQYLTMICNADARPEAELSHVKALSSFPASGIIFAGSGSAVPGAEAAVAEAARRAEKRGVLVTALARKSFECRTLTVDNFAACRDLTRYLVSIGHRRIAFVEGPPDRYASIDRLAGFRSALAEASLTEAHVYTGGFDFESGATAARRMLSNDLPDAVVAGNDESAAGLSHALREAGIDVPGQVSVAGIDDTRTARIAGLTTVRVPLYELGHEAARQMVTRTANDGPLLTLFPHEIVVRSSTAPRHSTRP
ncbi:MAG: LacI family DNA-binding transcriptional regulator [Actinobacteria bacterium]|jgi:LacI family transcriptional regulator|nr:LacI family DNA-binding transcriptional regulator [Actinomycetota bacterium]